jgi:hypothetical protein
VVGPDMGNAGGRVAPLTAEESIRGMLHNVMLPNESLFRMRPSLMSLIRICPRGQTWATRAGVWRR